VAGLLVALLLIAYGVWLVATPHYDGGRRPVGTLVLVVAVPVLAGSIWGLKSQQKGGSAGT
jgi:hypothetical protein